MSDNVSIKPIKHSHQLIKQFNNSSKKSINTEPALKQLQTMYQTFVRHSVRKPYQLEFIRCNSIDCEVCSKLPSRSNDFLSLIQKFGGTCPAPTPSEVNDEHFKTLLEMLRTVKVSSFESIPTEFGTCSKGCNRYCFYSKKDKERHFKFMGH